ncbi:MAG TPA: ATP-binding protein, partial [Chroococcales cyanobacterium]
QVDLKVALHNCAHAAVRHLDAAFARIWTLSGDGRELELQASAGMYTHLDGLHSRIAVGQHKIGLIAQERKPHLTNEAQNDPRVSDKDWARREKMTSFAGYPLVLEERLVGVMGMFSQKPLTESTLEALSYAAGIIAQGIERRRAEEALRRSEAFLAEGQRLGQIGSYSWRVATDKIEWSNELYRIYEFEIGVPVTLDLIRTRVHPQDISLYEKMVEKARDGGKNFEWQFRLLMADQSIKYLHSVAHAIRDQSGQLEYIAVAQDVTERRQSEEALRNTQAQLSRATRAATVGEFAASIAHEINQPLAAVVANGHACLRWLSAEPPGLARAQEAAERIVRDGKEAGEILRRIRALFKRAPLEKTGLNLNEVIVEVLRLLAGETSKRLVSVEMDLGNNLETVEGDRVQLQQLLFNLLQNGIEAMDRVAERPKKLFIRTRLQSPETVLVEIRDWGIGIENPEKAFEAFFTTKESGMGMGLAICRSIIDAHHGRLWAVPAEGCGTTFSFTLPAQPKVIA